MMYRISLCLLAATAINVLAADTAVDAKKSSIIATFKQEGVPVDASFTRFSGRITYDANNVASSGAALEVDTTSFDIGDAAYNAEVRKKEWFDTSNHPKASFKSTAIKPITAGRFEATGTLTLKGRVLTIVVPVSVSAGAYDGSFVISRKAFGIGDPIWEDVLDDKVSVRFHLLAH